MKKKFVIEATIDPKNVLGSEVFYAMNRLCSYQLRPDEDPQYHELDCATGDAQLIEAWLKRDVRLETAQEVWMDEIPFAPR